MSFTYIACLLSVSFSQRQIITGFVPAHDMPTTSEVQMTKFHANTQRWSPVGPQERENIDFLFY